MQKHINALGTRSAYCHCSGSSKQEFKKPKQQSTSVAWHQPSNAKVSKHTRKRPAHCASSAATVNAAAQVNRKELKQWLKQTKKKLQQQVTCVVQMCSIHIIALMGEAKTTSSEKMMQNIKNQQSTCVVWYSIDWGRQKQLQVEKMMQHF